MYILYNFSPLGITGILLLLGLIQLVPTIVQVGAYPLLLEIDSHNHQCLQLNLPDSDDFHTVFATIPADDDELAHAKPIDYYEDWFVEHISEMTNAESPTFMNEFPLTSEIESLRNKYNQKHNGVSVEVDPSGTNEILPFYDVVTEKHIVQNNKYTPNNKKHWDPDLGAYSICINNQSTKHIHVIYDFIILNDYDTKSSSKNRSLITKGHLSPLEQKLDNSIHVAKSIIDEMYYMEKREIRLKVTSDRTNGRIVWFSYLSVFILVMVAWIQSCYLNAYLKKKKVL